MYRLSNREASPLELSLVQTIIEDDVNDIEHRQTMNYLYKHLEKQVKKKNWFSSEKERIAKFMLARSNDNRYPLKLSVYSTILSHPSIIVKSSPKFVEKSLRNRTLKGSKYSSLPNLKVIKNMSEGSFLPIDSSESRTNVLITQSQAILNNCDIGAKKYFKEQYPIRTKKSLDKSDWTKAGVSKINEFKWNEAIKRKHQFIEKQLMTTDSKKKGILKRYGKDIQENNLILEKVIFDRSIVKQKRGAKLLN